MVPGNRSRAVAGSRAAPGVLLLLLVLLLLCSPAASARAAGPQPPTTAGFERATERLLAGPAFAPPQRHRPRGGLGGLGGTGFDDLLLPDNLLITLYGAPQLTSTELGKRSPRGAARKVVKQSGAYERATDRGVVSGFDLIGVVANSTPGPDRKYRTRQPDTVIAEYLERVRELEGRLMLDIQPGRSSVIAEIVALKKWIVQPDVDVGIDPEWNVGPRGVPGRTPGSISSAQINAASLRLDRIVENESLPPKVMIVHQFSKRMIRNRAAIKQRQGVQVVLNFDGIGSPAAKTAGFESLAVEGLFNGFSIFYSLDTRIMTPRSILALLPTVDFLLYQ